MSTKACLRSQLDRARQYSESLLADFRTPEQWTHQVHPEANHALWFAGHMGVSDNFFISQLDPAQAIDRSDLNALFGMGSRPTSSPADYPPVETVLAFMRERRQTFLKLLDALSDDDLKQPTHTGTPDFLPDQASVFQMAIWHEGLHSGQISVTRRAMGYKPRV